MKIVKGDKQKKLTIYFIVFFCSFIFIYNIYLLDIFTNGDQAAYSLFYDSIRDSNLLDLIDAGIRDIQTIEPMYLVVAYIASNLWIPKIIFSSALGAILIASYLLVFYRLGIKIVLLLSLICFGYYFQVLFTDLERLKLALIFLFIAIYYKNKKTSIILLLFSILSHFQILLVLSGIFLYFLYKKSKNILNIFYYKFSYINFLLVVFLIFLLSYSFYDHLFHKISYYSGEYNYQNFLNSLLFVIFFSLLMKDRESYLICVLPSIISTLFLAGGRSNILVFLISIYYICKKSNYSTFGLLMLALFSLLKVVMLLPAALDSGRWVF